MLEEKYCISTELAPKLYGIPYIISACTSPFLGLLVDKIGKRVLLIIGSSFLLLSAHLIGAFLPGVASNTPCTETLYSEIGPLVILGMGFSLYAAALWPSIPYVVEAKTVGTAFGICTAL